MEQFRIQATRRSRVRNSTQVDRATKVLLQTPGPLTFRCRSNQLGSITSLLRDQRLLLTELGTKPMGMEHVDSRAIALCACLGPIELCRNMI